MSDQLPPPADDAVAVAQSLQDTMDDWQAESKALRKEMARQRDYGRRNRRLIWGNYVGWALDVALSVLLAVVAFTAVHANSQAARNHDTQVASCKAGNDARSQNKGLWQFVIEQVKAANPHPRRAEQRVIDQFQAKVDTATALRDCDH